MMNLIFANNASSRLYAAIDAVTTSIRVEDGDGVKFPTPSGGKIFTVTIEDRRTGQVEICNCTGKSGDILNVVRGQEGTPAQAFALGAVVSNRLTAATMDTLMNSGAQGPTGPEGPAGPTGATGVQGPVGPVGPPGSTGQQGDPGPIGPEGPAGSVGPQGPAGPKGNTGATGEASSVPGPIGPEGPAGPVGPTGATGAASTVPGPPGATGPQGPQGTIGPQGPKGDTGPSGSSDWGAITNKPATFPPSAHGHSQSEVTNLIADLGLKAPLASPVFTGDPKAPTPAAADNDTSIATTAFVKTAIGAALFKRPYSYSGEAGQSPSSVGQLITDAAGSAATVLSMYSVPSDNSSNIGTLMESTIKPGSLIVLQKPGDLANYTIYEVTGKPVGQSGNTYYNIPIKWVMSYGAVYPVMAVDFIFALGGGGGAAATYIGIAPPATPVPGQMWWDSDSGRLFIYYADANTSQWVEAVAAPVDLTGFVTKAELDARVKWVPGGVQILDQTGFAVMGTTTNYTQFFSDWFDVFPRPDSPSASAGYHIRDKAGQRRARLLADTVGATGQLTIQTFNNANVGDSTFVIDPDGFTTSASLTVTGNVTATNHVFSSWGFIGSGNIVALAPTTPGEILLRAGGSGSILGEVKFDSTSNIHATMNNLTGSFALWAKDSGGTTRGNFVVPMSNATGSAYIRCMNNAGAYDNALTMSGNPSTASRMLTLSGAGAEKTTAGSWTAACDARIKEVHGDYEAGLEEILQLQPRRFHYKGNDFTSDPNELVKMSEDDEGHEPQSIHQGMEDTEVVGLIAQEAEGPLPETVKLSHGWIDGVEVDDLRQFDPSNLPYALINAVKELTAIVQEQAARIAALEAANGGV